MVVSSASITAPSITAIAMIHLFKGAALCCGGEELCDGAAAIAGYARHLAGGRTRGIEKLRLSLTVSASIRIVA
jgi:hypothetical protein